ncbi:MAG TPA: hypothetical protein VJ123_04090 [Anaerolineales bacterium]|nr:hypothetical protein [Anaerolineales bacterium]
MRRHHDPRTHSTPVHRPAATRLGLGLATAFMIGACGRGPAASPPSTAAAEITESLGCVQSEQGGCLPTAPQSARVDLAPPSFSDPTHVTNPLHPSSQLHSALLLGRAGGRPFRVEVTLLPGAKTIEWNGQPVETLESQYVAFLDGRIHEVALDWYAQADDGSVWYFGEDVFNYEDGVVADTHGTWLAGRDGPPAMIMPANPQVGDVYRPENIPGLVFEEVTVQSIDVTVDGPRGPVHGAIVVQELHMDGAYEDKTFAPGYGEFSTGSGDNLEALALGVPTDALPGPVPAELATLLSGAVAIFDAAPANDWPAASVTLGTMTTAWDAYRAGGAPPMLDAQMSAALDALSRAVDARNPSQARQAALDIAQASLDFQLRHRPPAEIDLARFDLWAHQLLVDAEADDPGAVSGDVATLEWMRDRFAHTLGSADTGQVDALLGELRAAAADTEDLAAVTAAAVRLRDLLARLVLAG